MKHLFVASMVACCTSAPLSAAEVDTRPPHKLIVTAMGARLVDVDTGYGGSLGYLHYFTPDVIGGIGVEHQEIAGSEWQFGSLRGAFGFGDPSTKTTLFGEAHQGKGEDETNRDFDYGVYVLGVSQSFTPKFSVQLESRQIEVDRSHGNLPKLGVTYVWTPQFVTNVAYANSVGGNIGTELTSARVDYYGSLLHVFFGGATGTADPIVLNLQPGVILPVSDVDEGFIGIGKSFPRGELTLLGDYLKSGDSEKYTVTLSFTAYIGARGGTP
jgi:hypothetical protein